MSTLIPLFVRFAGPVLLGVVSLAACSPDAGDSPATTTTPVAADGPIRFTQCVRDQGFELPDPSPGAQTVELPAKAKTDPAMAAAIDECRHLLGQGSGKNPDDPQQQDQAVALARCLRDRGVPVQDPAPGQPLRLNIDSKDPNAMKAVEDCRRETQSTSSRPASGQSNGR
ncbi:hypothetical protein [Kibdelosporangium phytohabitans]|uniref:Secreted protein n=1 Tax=Kibdelosporangium phytohabitans TaxID=860235 RepID=A0A0N7F4R7_9PSEU|nr:hypothetical protein [Kibdelosporangium phytohabitans]ALG12183.1 hypothetical protein AOZ06_39755 [Kibdelosporangium phytohabitans]MBE1463711.1 hypothetical protein [Kibdelosporangium phytohabitans]